MTALFRNVLTVIALLAILPFALVLCEPLFQHSVRAADFPRDCPILKALAENNPKVDRSKWTADEKRLEHLARQWYHEECQGSARRSKATVGK